MAFLEVNFFSDAIGVQTWMHVILPQRTRGNIGISQGEFGDKVPTLYLLHGMSDDHTIWTRRTSIERYAEEHGIAVVMPTTFLGWYTDMHYGAHFREYIGDELPKVCRKFFPALSDKREDTYIAGNSMGGYGSLALALTYPETFSIAAPLSACFNPKHLHHPEDPKNTYFFDIFGDYDKFDGSKNDLFYLAEKIKEEGRPLPSVYMNCGTEDGLINQNRQMRDHLNALGYDLEYSEGTGGHNWGYWDAEIQNVLKYISAKRAGKEN